MHILQTLVENSEGCTTSDAWGTWKDSIMIARPGRCRRFGMNSMHLGILNALVVPMASSLTGLVLCNFSATKSD